eukprot:CAMPEP_0113617548 /NCGR_PEP_ID=MMETSP0017_2-20120614/8840_1 /TAXON_ID=2856 /ORGANISM="Cylindrotheca closterium" /LENGTH=317 /DNA_ID=CAMNT_0000526953 /DNA_START=57 /DNA_END=1010 /DNA_ORIENTATION=- /assembly_acc=CAM_ASM_000147
MKEHRANIAIVEGERDAGRAAQTGLSQRLQESESNCTRLAEESSELAATKQSLEEEKQKLEEEVSKLQKADMQHRNKMKEHRANIAVLDGERDAARAAQTGLSQRLQESESNCTRLKEELAGLTIEREQLGEKNTLTVSTGVDLDGQKLNLDSVGQPLAETTRLGGAEALTDHDSRDEVEQHVELVQEKAVLQDGIEIVSSQSSGEKYLQTTGRMETLAREIEGEGGVRVNNENLEMDELRMQCLFLEHDRSELARVTNEILAMERESHALELEAAVASTRRQSMEDFQVFQQKTHQQMKKLYKSLCDSCRKRIDRA